MNSIPSETVAPAGFIVLLTACVAPKASIRAELRRGDPAQRELDYAEALRFWLQLPEPRLRGVVFADNSGHDLNRLRTMAEALPHRQRPIEFLSRDYPAPPLTLNYGHPEFLLVNEALRDSRLLATERHFIKATGRYRFPTICRLLRRLPSDFRVAVDARMMFIQRKRWDKLINVSLALFERDFYLRELAGIPDQMVPAPPWNRKQFIEHMFFDALHPRREEPGILLRWPCNCEPIGIGANGEDYSSMGKQLRSALRAAARHLVPNLWL